MWHMVAKKVVWLRRRKLSGTLYKKMLNQLGTLALGSKMVIYEQKKFILTNYKNARNGAKAIDTDHFTEYMDVNLEIITEKPERREI